MIGVLAAAAALAGSTPDDWRPSPSQSRRVTAGDVLVDVSDRGGATSVHAAVDIRAAPTLIYGFLTSCAEAPKLAAFFRTCRVLSGPGPRGGWDVREADVTPAILLPRIRAVFRSRFVAPWRISFRCVPPSELAVCAGEWRIEPMHGGTARVTYAATVAMPYSAPSFMVRAMVRGEIASSLRKLRRLATEP